MNRLLQQLLITLVLGAYAFSATIAWKVWELSERVAHIEHQHKWAFDELLELRRLMDENLKPIPDNQRLHRQYP